MVLATALVNELVEAADEDQGSRTGTLSNRLASTKTQAERTAASWRPGRLRACRCVMPGAAQPAGSPEDRHPIPARERQDAGPPAQVHTVVPSQVNEARTGKNTD